MKRFLLILLLSILPFLGMSQRGYKLVEKSSKKKPTWLTNADYHGAYMIQANKVATMEEAQNAVMSSLLNMIASSVAVQVTGEIVKNVDWTVVNDKETYIENIKNNTTTKIAKMPVFQGISLTKADVYWEKYINKKTKEVCYDYYILYPFSTAELQKLIESYNAYEEEVNDEIDNYRELLDDMDDIDMMLENIDEMKNLMKELGEVDVKYNKLKDVVKLYEKTIKDIYVEVIENSNDNDNGTLVIQLMHDEKVMNTKSLPQLRSSCARDFAKRHDGDKIVLSFNTYDCYEQDDNYVEVRFTFGKRKLIKKINIRL